VTQLANLFTRRLPPPFGRTNITLQQWLVLTALAGCGPATLAHLARRMCVSKQNMTGMVNRLTDAGYVARGKDPDDLRSSRVVLTRRGKALVDKLRPSYEQWRAELARDAGGEKIAETERIIAALIEKLDRRG
jgi:DNA-binding MarR family transcriptional regulator